MTTWAATGYVPRLLEIVGLADVVLYVASDERYNDEVPTQFLQLLLQTGKPVVVCLMKMREADAPALVAHFQQEVLSRLPPGVVGTLAIPFLRPEQLADPARLAGRYRIPLLNQVAVLGRPAAATLPEQSVLEESLAGWLDLLRKEAARQAGTHPLWDHIAAGFTSGKLPDTARERFREGFRNYQLSETEEVEHTARAIYED